MTKQHYYLVGGQDILLCLCIRHYASVMLIIAAELHKIQLCCINIGQDWSCPYKQGFMPYLVIFIGLSSSTLGQLALVLITKAWYLQACIIILIIISRM